MATASFTWAAWDTTNAWQNLADAANSSSIAYARDSTDVAAKFTQTTKSVTQTEYARKSGAGDTWESIFAIAANSVITAVQLAAWKRKLVTNTKLTSHSLTVKLINDSAGTIATLISAGATSTSTDASYTAQTAGTNQTGLNIASNTNVRLSLEYTCVTGGTGGSAAVDCRWDDFQVTITYTTYATYTTSANLDALVQKAGVEKTSSLHALVQKTGIANVAGIDAQIQKIGLTSAASLNALAQKSGLAAMTDLNAILANIVMLNRLTDVALSGTPRVCISQDRYFKVYPARGGSETPDIYPAARKTYDDAALSGTPVRLGFAYEGDLYWIKGYATAAATENPTGDGVQNLAFAIPDDAITGAPAVFRILSGGNYYYFKAYLDSVIQVQELYIQAGLDAILSMGGVGHTTTAVLGALLQKAGLQGEAGLNALIQKAGLTGLANLGALLRKDGLTRGGNLDALLAGIHSVTVSLSALIQKQAIPKTAAADALLQKAALTSLTSLNALIQKAGLTGLVNLGALLRKDGLTRGGNLDALLAGIHSVTVSLSALIQKQAIPKTAAADALLRKDGLASGGSLDALLAGIHSVAVSLSALIQKQAIPKTTAADALLQKSETAALSMDSLLEKVGLLKVAGLDSALQKTGIEAAASLDALLSGLTASFANLDALLGKMISARGEIDALIQRQDVAAGAAMDAILLEGMRDLPLQYCRVCKILYFMDESDRCPKCGWIPGSSMTSPALTQSIDISPAGEMPAEGGVIAGALADLPLCVCRNCGMGFLLDGQMDGEMECCPRCGWTPGKTENYTETYTEKGEDYAEI